MDEEEDEPLLGSLNKGGSDCEGRTGSSNCQPNFAVKGVDNFYSLNGSNSDLDRLVSGRSLTAQDELWVVPMLVISAVCVAVISIYQVLIICRAAKTSPSRRHLFLSQVLP